MARTGSPGRIFDTSPSGMARIRPSDAILTTARSRSSSLPRTMPAYDQPLTERTVTNSWSSTTWALVMMRPSLETAKPEPLARGVIICTSPCSMFSTTSDSDGPATGGAVAVGGGAGEGGGMGEATRDSSATTVACTLTAGGGVGATRVSMADTVAGTFTS